ncbi:4'-phosphopantetheinyl transferase family protein [Streptomyces sp. NPDC087850]|uniref:4'-phosphopantetheinyl transferase family protein n=1 Tax=Streptomyces sp. NPDC087850 TaxID=3365809 RepID=UPI00381FF502
MRSSARVRVWVAGPGSDWLPADRLLLGLPRDERERALGLGRDARARFARSRALRRAALSEATGTRPEDLRYRLGAHGKPSLPGGPGFSVSDTGEVIAVAVAADRRALGVDLEEIRPLPTAEIASIARRFFGTETARALSSLMEGRRTAAFYTAWTRYEALVKATGEGLVPRRTDPRALLAEGPVQVMGPPGSGSPLPYVLTSFRPAVSVAGAVCVRGGTLALETLPVPRTLGGVRLQP